MTDEAHAPKLLPPGVYTLIGTDDPRTPEVKDEGPHKGTRVLLPNGLTLANGIERVFRVDIARKTPGPHVGQVGDMRALRLYMSRAIEFDYTNHRGETKKRRALPESVRFEETPYHKPAQWIMRAYDYEKHAQRSFAMKDMNNVRDVVE